MDKRFREKLAKIFGMFGSANVSEHEAARRKIDGILALNKKTWNDLTELLQIGKGEDNGAIQTMRRHRPPAATQPTRFPIRSI